MAIRKPSLTKFKTDDEALDRVQDHIVQTLNPVLANPSLSMVDWRLTEGPYPSATSPNAILVQHRTPPDTWATVAAFDSTGGLTAGSTSAITQGAWIAPTLLNSWVNWNSTTFYPAGYIKDSLGWVHLRGVIKNGTALGSVMFTLPAGYRPARESIHVIAHDDGAGGSSFARLDVLPTGDLQIISAGGTTGFASLDGITFDTRL